jgi:hypothetical protein
MPAVDIGWVTSGRRSDLRQTSGYLGRPGGPYFIRDVTAVMAFFGHVS